MYNICFTCEHLEKLLHEQQIYKLHKSTANISSNSSTSFANNFVMISNTVGVE